VAPPAPEIATFTYHDVTDAPTDSGFQRPAAMTYKLSTALFRDHLDAIAAQAGAPELVTAIDFTSPERHVLLTFDDGGVSALAIGEELARRGWRGHFFVVTRLVGARRFLKVQQVRELQAAGHIVGSHSHTHPDIFNAQPPQRMAEEWRVSADIIAQLTGAPCTSASVPGGDISRAVLESAAQAGFRFLFTSEPHLRPRRVDSCWALGRYCARVGTSSQRIGELARFHGWNSALLARRLKGFARAGLPTLYKRYVQLRTRQFQEVD
jgi:peptidoglycan/xylan/chitin deacetylase (PgdA/CDA1 family)